MFFNHNNDLDDSNFNDKKYEKKKINEKLSFNSFKLPLIILGSILFLILIIFLVSKLINKERIAYDDKLYYINLLGGKEVILYLDEDYVEPGYTGTDDEGNDLTSQVVITNNVDNSKIGNYKVSYTLGNITKERNVKVIEKPTGATYIYLYGDVNTFLYIGEEYQEKGYEVIDMLEGSKLKDKVKINSNVDTSKEGIYKVIYSVTNTSGVTTSKERTVIVMDRNLSLIPDITYSTNKNITINIYAKDELFSYLILPNNNKINERISTYEISSNGTYKFIMYNDRGEKTEKQITINNIDRESPSGSCSGSFGNGVSQINISASDNIGISKYVINGTTYTTSSIKINGELASVNVTIYDKAGNTKTISCKLDDKRPASSSSKPSSSSSKPSSSSSKPSSSSPKPSSSSTLIKYDEKYEILKYAHPGGYTFDYVLNVPKGATNNLPLVVFLHGDGQINSPKKISSVNAVNYMLNKYSGDKFILLAPVTKEASWINGSIPTSLKGLIDKIVNEYQINTKKIYIMGFSRGAIGTWNMVNLYPNYFAAAVPISCCKAPGNNANNFLHTKIRAISGTYDIYNEGGYHMCMTEFVNAINKAGGSAIKDTYNGQSHSSIGSAIKYDELFAWLLNQ